MFKYLKKHFIGNLESKVITDNISPVLENAYQINEKKLLNGFDRLNALLEQDNADIKIDITKLNSKEYIYQLKSYKLDFRNKSLRLELQLDDRAYSMVIDSICEIEIYSMGNSFKIYIHYLYVDPFDNKKRVVSETVRCFISNVKEPDDIKRCNTKYYEREEKEYEKYRFSDPLKYYVEKTIYEYTENINGKILGKGEYTLKSNTSSKYCLLRVEQDNNCDVFYIDEHGERAMIYMELKDNSKLEVIDVVPNPTNEGIGTNAFNLIFDYINRTKEINKIYGSMSHVDDDHSDRRNHFYRKLGFTIEGMRITKTFDKQ